MSHLLDCEPVPPAGTSTDWPVEDLMDLSFHDLEPALYKKFKDRLVCPFCNHSPLGNKGVLVMSLLPVVEKLHLNASHAERK